MKIADRQAGGEAQAGRWLPHPAALIALWAMLAVAIQLLSAKSLLLAATPLALLALKVSAARLATLLRRTRWIMFSLLLIYGYATPGTALFEPLGMLSPTAEGLQDGLLQLLRLLLALAALAIVLGLLSRQQLLGGLYTLAYPLRYLGLSRERVAVRLALTLHYAESALHDASGDWRGSIERVLAPVEVEPQAIELYTIPFRWRDGVLLACAAACAAVLL